MEIGLAELATVVDGELTTPAGTPTGPAVAPGAAIAPRPSVATGPAVTAEPPVIVRRVTVHSGQAQAGSAFFALTGRRTDGTAHAAEALAGGAAVVVAARDRAQLVTAGGPLILVDDPLVALQRLAGWWRSRLPATVVAVVGSHGKTVTKDALVHFARPSLRAYGSPGSYNSQLGVALALLECPADAQLAVIEAAASEPGEMARLAAMVRPDHVVLTYLGSRYAARFGDPTGYARELLTMAAGLGPASWLLVGREDDRLVAATEALSSAGSPPGYGGVQRNGRPRRLVHGVSDGLPRFSPPEHGPDSLRVQIAFPDDGSSDLTVATTSAEVLTDVELAISAGWLLRPNAAPLAAGPAYSPTSTVVETWQTSTGVTLVRDVATADPITVSIALRTARRLRAAKGRAFVVLADPLTMCAPDQAEALGRIIGAGGVDGLCGLDTPTHAAVAAGLRQVDPSVPVTLFGGGPAEGNSGLRTHLIAELRDGDVALIEAPAGRSIVDLSRDLIESMPPTRLYIDASALESNVATFRRLIGPSTRIMGMVKALAYGTNAVQVTGLLRDAGVDFLGVASADEGAALRRAGVDLPVLVMLGTAGEVEKMLRHGLVPLVYSPAMLDAVLAEARASIERGGAPVPVHVEVDSGMHRTGFQPDAALEVLRRLRDAPAVRLEGLMTHLACADLPAEDEFTRDQLRRYQRVVDHAYELGFDGFLRHAANTAGTIRFPEAHLDLVRIGVGLYGVQPSAATAAVVDLDPAVSLVSRVVETYDLRAGERVGYGGTFVAPAGGSRIGVVPAGYADCVPRAFSNFGRVTVGGATRPIVGVVSMDSMTIDLTDTPSAQLGSDVLIYGRRAGVTVPLEEVSAAIGTIGYELLVRVGPRVQRIFTRH